MDRAAENGLHLFVKIQTQTNREINQSMHSRGVESWWLYETAVSLLQMEIQRLRHLMFRFMRQTIEMKTPLLMRCPSVHPSQQHR